MWRAQSLNSYSGGLLSGNLTNYIQTAGSEDVLDHLQYAGKKDGKHQF
jgi:hypothetical protein